MRWAYKTIHYGLKKDGLLGGTFLDESEIEESLNEFGGAGWELVSLLEVRDGVIAVLKQSIGEFVEKEETVIVPEVVAPRKERLREAVKEVVKPGRSFTRLSKSDQFEDEEDDAGVDVHRVVEEKIETSDSALGVGFIRIE